MLTIMMSFATTPMGLAMASVVPLLTLFAVALPPRWKMLVVLLVTRIFGLESIGEDPPPAPLWEPAVKA